MCVELELKFTISKQVYQRAFDFFSKEISIENYCFCKPIEKHIADTYFDTSNFNIAQHNSGLRLRTINNAETLIALKTSYTGGNDNETISRRYELEDYISNRFLSEIHKALTRLQIVNNKYVTTDEVNVNRILQNWNLQQIFCIDNNRQIIDVIKNDAIIAEIALDAIHYSLQPVHKKAFEMEIEAKDCDNQTLHYIKHIVEKQLNTVLQHSSMSKYKRGLILIGACPDEVKS